MPTLNWIGKEKVVTHHLDVPYRVLNRKYTFGDTPNSGNMIIHGDNLEALKALLPQYEGKIKCIYIDPPYNTGNEGWVYNDNVNDPHIRRWLGQVVGSEADDLTRHDKWLCMMYPRLVLLQRLLSEDGAIFISIDDNEQANLKLICDEILGKTNHLACMPIHRQGGRQDSKYYAVVHEYLLCYAKSIVHFKAGVQIKEESIYPKFDVETGRYYKTQLLRKWGSNSLRENRPNLYYPITAPDGTEVYPIIYQTSSGSDSQFIKIESCWRWSASNMANAIKEKRVEFVKNEYGEWIPYERIFAPAEGEYETKKFSTWIDEIGNGTKTLKEIFNGTSPFDYPKAIELLVAVLKMASADKDSIILDSFAGSGTTAHAVLNLNKQDGGNRKFILCEMMDYAENITAERVRRVMKGYGEGKNVVEGTGGSFDFYELGETIFDPVTGNLNDDADSEQIRRYVWFSETNSPYTPPAADAHPYFLGTYQHNNYYFYYIREKETCLDRDFLRTFTQKDKAEMYIIYADRCVLTNDEMLRMNIRFKKIPRDIKRV